MSQSGTRPPGTGGYGLLLIAVGIVIVLIVAVAWARLHPPVRSRVTTAPPLGTAGTPTPQPATPPAGGGPVIPTPTPGPNDVMVYTLDGREVCNGFPVGNLGYELRCAVPADTYLFRVINSAGESVLAVRYNGQMVVRVGP